MIKKEVLEFFENRHDDQGIPKIPAAEWAQLIETYEKDDIRESLAEYIHSNKIGFPIKNIEDAKLKQLFKEFCSRSLLDQVKHFDVVEERYPYLHKYSDRPLGVIDKSHFFNPVSDYFQQENRMKCGSNTSSAPLEIWNDQAKLAKMNWTFWRKGILEDDDLTAKNFRSAFRLGTYTATQFKPSVAKVLYEKHGAKNVLDTSCGWGDRLAGFYATPSTELYVGCDPNPDVFEVYKKQCVFYEKELGCTPIVVSQPNYFECHGKKTVKIWNLPSEDVDWTFLVHRCCGFTCWAHQCVD